ncbi:maleylacetate reductase, partial [Aureobasidium melanogenum]
MLNFIYNASPMRVLYGEGSTERLPSEISRLKKCRPLLLSTPHRKNNLADLVKILEKSSILVAGTFDGAVMHTPVAVTETALSHIENLAADCIISYGGGSTIGLGKALSIRTRLPHIAIPSTYAGSEMTPILGETKDGLKTTRSDPAILPTTVIYDVRTTLTLPVGVSMTSGINAIAHAIEALYAKNINPLIEMLALEGIRRLTEALPHVATEPNDLTARSAAQYGAWLCGICLGSVGMGLHHKLCHTLGGSWNLPHAETHTIVLPHALAYNAPAIPQVMVKLAAVIPDSEGNAIEGLEKLLEKVGFKKGLKDYGMQEHDIAEAAQIAAQSQYPNVREIEATKITEVIRRCWAGEPARPDL